MTTNKLLIGVGAIALAAAASLTPLVAQAEPASDNDSSAASSDSASTTSDTGGDVGNAAGRKASKTNRGGTPRADAPPPSVVSGARTDTAPGAGATGSNPLFQNPFIWFGQPNPAPPTPVYTREFNALADLPDWTQAYSGWFSNLNFEACVLGLSNTTIPSAGPYGTSTNSIRTGGC
jgi:hypothetical protein